MKGDSVAQRLAAVLSNIFDAKSDGRQILSRAQWAQAFNVSESTLACWILNMDTPAPRHLQAMRDVMVRDDRFKEVFAQFEAIIDEPLDAASAKKGATLRHQIVALVREGFLNALDTIPAASQERVLWAAYRLIRKERSAEDE